MTKAEQFEGCIIGGAIGDAWGSGFENQFEQEDDTFYLLGNPDVKLPTWGITDDTQLTLATIEAMIEGDKVRPESVANKFLQYYKKRKLRGIGASTLKSLKELELGGIGAKLDEEGNMLLGTELRCESPPLHLRKKLPIPK